MKNYNIILIVIVDYFKADRVVENTLAILKQEDCDLDVIVSIVDNSCDLANRKKLLTLDKYSNVQLNFNNKNTGYITACNEATKNHDAGYIILVNPDITWSSKKTLSGLINFMEKNIDIGICGPKQINDDGSIPNIVRSFPSITAQVIRRSFLKNISLLKPIVDRYELSDFDYNKSQYVPWIQSSMVIIRGDLWNKTRGLDERYFLFMADPEICFDAWENNYSVFYNAEFTVGADGKRCSAGGFKEALTSKSLQFHIKDAIKYQLKHLFKSQPKNINYSRLIK